jgi:hypothetical protein
MAFRNMARTPVCWTSHFAYAAYQRCLCLRPMGQLSRNWVCGETFSTPPLVGLYGILFSAGKSIFVFSPPLLLSRISHQSDSSGGVESGAISWFARTESRHSRAVFGPEIVKQGCYQLFRNVGESKQVRTLASADSCSRSIPRPCGRCRKEPVGGRRPSARKRRPTDTNAIGWRVA